MTIMLKKATTPTTKMTTMMMMVMMIMSMIMGTFILTPVTAQRDARIKDIIGDIFGNSHFPAIARDRTEPPPTHINVYKSILNNDHPPCTPNERYRRPNGFCNHLRMPLIGGAFDRQTWQFADTYQDGKGFPRVKDKDSNDLPSAREVSVKCIGHHEDDTNGDGPSDVYSQLMWQFGQFIAHDMTSIVPPLGMNSCCDEFSKDYPFAGLYSGSGYCFPIAIPDDDPFFKENCMVFSRSYAVEIFGKRSPINGVTALLDMSQLYSSSIDETLNLRTGVQGLLKFTIVDGKMRLSNTNDRVCKFSEKVNTCPVSGDPRVSGQPGTGALHIVFLTIHNMIARKLFQFNTHWDDERIFQETRKIVTAFMQKIIYKDYLPLLLGNDLMDIFGLNSTYKYRPRVVPRINLEFSTAAFRFGHSMVNSQIDGKRLREIFLVPINTGSFSDTLIPFSQAAHKSSDFGPAFTTELKEWLFHGLEDVPGFSPSPGPSFDLPSINIQRGRDHGLASYVTARDECAKILQGIPGQFNTLPQCFTEGAYKNEEDIDLYVGGLSEMPLPGALLGPTFACVVAEQFRKLRSGDRFFYETTGFEGFTPDQLSFIQRTTLASLVCQLNPDGSIQRDAFRTVSPSNPVATCSTILAENNVDEALKMWMDNNEENT